MSDDYSSDATKMFDQYHAPQAYSSPATQLVDQHLATKAAVPQPSAADTLASTARATAKGIYHGMDMFATTLDKGIAYALGDKSTLNALQSTYETNTKQYNADKDTNAHPWASGIGNFTGGMIATAPLSLLSGGATAGLFAGAAADAGLTGTAAQLGAKVLGYGLANTAQGAVTGGLITEPGMGENIINKEGARIGALIGAATALVQGVLDKWFFNTKEYADYAKQLKQNFNYKGPIADYNVPALAGTVSNIKQATANYVAGQIPFVKNIPGIGVNSANEAQVNSVKTAIGKMIQTIGDKYPNGTLDTFNNIIQDAKTTANQTIANVSKDFRNSLTNAGITTHDMNSAYPLAQDLLKLPKSQTSLSTDARNALAQLAPTTETDKLLYTDKQPGIKNIIWSDADRLSGDPTKTKNFNTSNALKNIYNAINTDITNSIPQNNSDLLEKWHTFNTTTNNIKDLWSKETSPHLANAVQDYTKDQQGIVSLFNYLKQGNMPSTTAAKYNTIIGKSGQETINNSKLLDAYNKAYDTSTGKLNLGAFSKAVGDNPVINGLMSLASQATQNQAITKNSGFLTEAGKAGAIGGASLYHPVVAVVASGVAALGAIVAHAPARNALIALDNAAQFITSKPEMVSYLLKGATSRLGSIGVLLSKQPDGSIQIDKSK